MDFQETLDGRSGWESGQCVMITKPRGVYRGELQEAPLQHSKPSYVHAVLTAGCRGWVSFLEVSPLWAPGPDPGASRIVHHVLME